MSANMWGKHSWREIQPLYIKVFLLVAFGAIALLYAVDARLTARSYTAQL